MRQPGIGRRAVLLATLTLPTLPRLAAGAPESGPAPGHVQPAQLLVAAEDMVDPHFARTVVLMVRHDDDGALGLVLNRPLGERSLASLLQAIGADSAGVSGTVRIFSGGPVQADMWFVLHTADYRRDRTLAIGSALALTNDAGVLRDIGQGKGPRRSLVALGYAGWGPGQLETELMAGGWVVVSGDPKLVFDDDRAGLWAEAMARRTVPL